MKGKRELNFASMTLNFASMTLNFSALLKILEKKQLLKTITIQQLVFPTTLPWLIVGVGKIPTLGKCHYPFHFAKFYFYKSLAQKRPIPVKNLNKFHQPTPAIRLTPTMRHWRLESHKKASMMEYPIFIFIYFTSRYVQQIL